MSEETTAEPKKHNAKGDRVAFLSAVQGHVGKLPGEGSWRRRRLAVRCFRRDLFLSFGWNLMIGVTNKDIKGFSQNTLGIFVEERQIVRFLKAVRKKSGVKMSGFEQTRLLPKHELRDFRFFKKSTDFVAEENLLMRVAERYKRDLALLGVTNDQNSNEVLGVNKALTTAPETLSSMTLEEQEKKQRKALKTLEKVAKHWTERETSLQIVQQCMKERTQVLVGIDIEAYEFNHEIVTEIGIATLDLSTVDKPRKAEPKARHLRPTENVKYKNKVFVPDHSGDFSFGESEVLPMKQCALELRKIFADLGDRAVFVAHGSVQDIKWLNKMGVNLPKAMPQINTQHVWNQLYGDKAPAKLEFVLRDLGIKAKKLHNAANDAYYTVQAAVRMGEEVEEEQPWWPRSQSQSPSQSSSTSLEAIYGEDEDEASSLSWSSSSS